MARSSRATEPAGSAGGSGVMADADASTPARAPRRDAQRNHDALLAAASAVFAEKGIDAPLDEIARRAGVGIGTLYRHFPTRDQLNEAAYRREVEVLCDSVPELEAEHRPVDALSAWMRRFSGYVTRKRGMAMALKSALGTDNELFTYSHQRITQALEDLIKNASDAGEIRTDVSAKDLLHAMSGICMASDQPGGAERVDTLIGIVIDGLRYGASAGAR